MTPAEWNKIAALVYQNWDGYDGFVILSGTDTLVRLTAFFVYTELNTK